MFIRRPPLSRRDFLLRLCRNLGSLLHARRPRHSRVALLRLSRFRASQQYQKGWHEENRRAQRNGEGQPVRPRRQLGPPAPSRGTPLSLERALRVVDFSPCRALSFCRRRRNPWLWSNPGLRTCVRFSCRGLPPTAKLADCRKGRRKRVNKMRQGGA